MEYDNNSIDYRAIVLSSLNIKYKPYEYMNTYNLLLSTIMASVHTSANTKPKVIRNSIAANKPIPGVSATTSTMLQRMKISQPMTKYGFLLLYKEGVGVLINMCVRFESKYQFIGHGRC